MKTLLCITIAGISTLTFGQITNTTGATGVPYNEVTHKNVTGALTTTSGQVIEGKITYNEYDDRSVYITPEGKDQIHFANTDSIQSMALAGRGVFESISMNNSEYKTLALVIEETDAYKVYQKCSVGKGLLGYTISGGMMQGEYLIFLFHKRKNTMIAQKSVKKIEETIGQYLDYCDEIKGFVEEEKKGYKVNLMFRDMDVLKKALLEAETTCPQ